MHLLDPPDRLRAAVIAALQTDDHAVVGYLSLDADINFASFIRYQIGQLTDSVTVASPAMCFCTRKITAWKGLVRRGTKQ